MSSTTALVRSPSNSTGVVPSRPRSPATPSATSTTTLPKLNLTPLDRRQSGATPDAKSSSTQLALTPPSLPPAPPSSATSTPGRWQHPRKEEVLRRQSKTYFDNRNSWTIIYNVGFISISFVAPALLAHLTPQPWMRAMQPYPDYTIWLIRLFLIMNIGIALAPLFRTPDPCDDIPLTPAQRQLLGLPPLSRPATPQEQAQYITPPRFATRSASGTPSSSTPVGTPAGSPAGSLRAESNSPLQNLATRAAAEGERERKRRRSSYLSTPRRTSSSSLSMSDFDAVAMPSGMSAAMSTKNPRASVGLNSKWLYEKGRASPVPVVPWGTGSVFT